MSNFKHSYYILENTGWSNKTSWFAESNNKRYDTYTDALSRYNNIVNDRDMDNSILWRITKITTEYEYTNLKGEEK
jgi:hypothetical protein